MAAMWKLPVIYICENNRYGMGTAIHRPWPRPSLALRREYGMPGESVDGMDVLAVRGESGARNGRAGQEPRPDRGPDLPIPRPLDADPAGAVYRTREEVEREKQRDPIAILSERCLREGILAEADIKAIEKDVNDTVDDAVAFADASPEPPAEWLLTDVYKE